MKKFLLSLTMLFYCVLGSNAQWTRISYVDEYTQEVGYYCAFKKSGSIIAAYFPNTKRLVVGKYYQGIKYWDITWDACMNNGYIDSQSTNVTARYIFNGNYKEYDYDVTINFSNIEAPGNEFIGTFAITIDDEDLESLKKGKSISFKWINKIENYNTSIINVSLIGFTKCLNSCIK